MTSPFSPKSPIRRGVALLAAVGLACAGVIASPGTARADGEEQSFHHVNTAAGSAEDGSASDSALTADGKTMVSVDSKSSSVVFTDLTDPTAPRQLGQLPLSNPRAVAIAGDRALVIGKSGLTVYDIAKRSSIGQRKLPRSTDVAASREGDRAAVALASGRLVLFSDLAGDPADWTMDRTRIELDEESGLDRIGDPRPDQLAYSPDGRQIAITLPENNGISVVQAADGERVRAIYAGTANLTGIDAHDDGTVRLTDNLYTQKRRPAGVAWIDDDHLASASPGTRSWSVYDTDAGKLTWDSGTGMEYRAINSGVYSDHYSADGGTAPETVAVGTFGDTPYAFIGASQGNFVAGYDLSNLDEPEYRQLLPTPADAPIAAAPDGRVLAVGGSSIFQLRPGRPSFPSMESKWTDGVPLGWDGTTGLSADQFQAERIHTLSGSDPTQILSINTSTTPATIDTSVPLARNGKPYGAQVVDLHQGGDGNFLIAATGERAQDNKILFADRNGNITNEIGLPADVTEGVADNGGLGGISGQIVDGTEYYWVAFRQPLQRDPDGIFRLGRYNTEDRTWTWFGYDSASAADDIELTGINVIGEHRLSLVEQDRSAEGRARVEKLFTAEVPTRGPAEDNDLAATLTAQPATDLLSRFTKAGDPLPTRLVGLTTAGNDHAFLMVDSSRDPDAGSQLRLVDLGTTADAFPLKRSALGVTLSSWLLPLIGVCLIGVGSLVAAGLAVRDRLRRRPSRTAVAT